MYAAWVALLIWTGPHTPCVWARPYDGEPALSEGRSDLQPVQFFAGGGLLEDGPDRQSATVCAPPGGERVAFAPGHRAVLVSPRVNPPNPSAG
jgi:hypothetical protein